MDVVNAFPNSELDEVVYVEFPDGFRVKEKVCRLLRALYGLRRSPLLWQRLLSQVFRSMGLVQSIEEPCLFTNKWLFVFYFVDDILYAYRPIDAYRAE